MIEGWGASGSASVDMNLVSDYLNSYTKYSEIMQEIRKVNPAEYMKDPNESEIVLQAILRDRQYTAQAERCTDLISRVEQYMKDIGMTENN